MYKNEVFLEGTLEEDGQYSHEYLGERFFSSFLSVERLSGAADILPITISEQIITLEELKKGVEIGILGSFRSRNEINDGKSRLKLSVFASEIVKKDNNHNKITLTGNVVKPPIYRETPLGRQIADLLIACNRNTGKSDYIPCIVWGRNARFVKNLTVGDKITLSGRIQSREYQKKLSETDVKTMTAYEVSASIISLDEQKGN